MLYENEFEKISKISSNPFIKDLIELNIIESADDLSFSDYLLLWLLTIEKLPSNEKKMEGNDFVDDYIEVNETITEEEYWNIMKRLEDSGFTIIKVLFEHAAFLITVRSKTGKLYKFKVFCKGGATVDDYEGNDYSESENDNEDSVESTFDNNNEKSELVEAENTKENNEPDDKTTELVDGDKTSKTTSTEKISETVCDEKTETSEKDTVVSPEVRAEINEKSNYSPEVNSYINSVEELEIYQKAGLEEVQINGRTCLIRSDIDMDQEVDEFGMTNADLIKEGYAPFDKNGHRIELHHIGQKDDAPLAELKFEEHRSSETYSILHDTNKESEINRSDFNNEREAHWKSRS